MLSNLPKSITSPIERLANPLSRRNTATEEPAWHAAFPEPRHKAAELPDVEKEDVLSLLKQGKKPGDRGGFLLVDVRRNDHEVRMCLLASFLACGGSLSLTRRIG